MLGEVPATLQIIYRADPDSLPEANIDFDRAMRDGIEFQKWWDSQARVRLVPYEVLDASDASSEERAFLIEGKPFPGEFREINYLPLVRGERSLVLPEEMPNEPKHGDVVNGLGAQMSGTFKAHVHDATIRALSDSDMCVTETMAVYKADRPDPHAKHTPIYHPLVPAPAPSEETVYQS